MSDRKKVIAYYPHFQEMYFSKDLFLVPYYIAKEKGLSMEFYYGRNDGTTPIADTHRGVQMHCLDHKRESQIIEVYDTIRYILPKVKKIDTLFVVGISFFHLFRVYLIKKLNPNVNIVVLGDMEKEQAEVILNNDFYHSKTIIGRIKKHLADFFFTNTTFLVANSQAHSILKRQYIKREWTGLLHFYPCLDDELFNSYGLKRTSFKDKENVIVCVGRIGNYQKNTEMLLDALKYVDLKDWKIYMIGPITSSFNLKDEGNFQKKIDTFFEDCPQHKGKLIFTGMIYDMKEVFEYYNRAKVLLLTSRHEGFANVFSQAAALGCYIISTNVGGADVASNQWRYGYRLGQADVDGLTVALQNLVDGKLVPDESQANRIEDMSYSYRINRVLLSQNSINPLVTIRNYKEIMK